MATTLTSSRWSVFLSWYQPENGPILDLVVPESVNFFPSTLKATSVVFVSQHLVVQWSSEIHCRIEVIFVKV